MPVEIFEVRPRDGLEKNQPRTLSSPVRAELVARLVGATVRRVEAVSFVSADRVPAMAGAEAAVAALGDRAAGATRAGLVLNERGYDRLAASGLEEVHVAFGATERFNRRSQRATSMRRSTRPSASCAPRTTTGTEGR